MLIGDTSEAMFMDGTHCRVHHSNGPGSAKDKPVGKSRGRLNNKSTSWRTPSESWPPHGADARKREWYHRRSKLPENLEDTAVVGDKGQDSGPLRDRIRAWDCEPWLPARKNVWDPEPYDVALYRTRHAVENVFEASQGIPQTGQPI